MSTHTPHPPPPVDANGAVASVFDSLRRIIDALYAGSIEAQRSHRITAAQHFVLFQLSLRPSMSINDLAELTMTHQSTVSVVVGRLVRKKLVRKRRADDDARRIEVSLTAIGLQVVEHGPEPFQVRLRRALTRLPRPDQDALAGTLLRVLLDVGADTAPGAMFFEAVES